MVLALALRVGLGFKELDAVSKIVARAGERGLCVVVEQNVDVFF